MSAGTLLLRLAGPTCAWHVHRSRSIDTSPTGRISHERLWPTRSAVLGLLAGAQGRPRGGDMGDLLDLDMMVRADQPGRRRGEFKTGRRRDGRSKVVTGIRRETVLDDACFLVGVSGDLILLDELYAACRRPVWAPYLGQLAYPVTLPLELAVLDEELEAAMRSWPWLASEWYRREQSRSTLLELRRSRYVGDIADETIDMHPVEVENPIGRHEPDWMEALR